jgi:hypothetical protein
VATGDAAEGLSLLEQAWARGGKPRHQAGRSLFLGDAHAALGKHEDAVKAWKRAIELDGSSPYAERAKRQLESMSAYR